MDQDWDVGKALMQLEPYMQEWTTRSAGHMHLMHLSRTEPFHHSLAHTFEEQVQFA
jgi:hypothetical protein